MAAASAASRPAQRVVLITGCSTGLGRALVVELGRRPDVKVVATARRLAAIQDLLEQGLASLALEVDVRSEASLKAAMEKAAALGGGCLDAVVCNAGGAAFGPLALQPMAEVQAVMDTNCFGVLRTVQAAVPFMARPQARGGRILIVGSVSATLTTPFAGAYCASKAAVHTFGEALRMELRPLGISVTNIHAGLLQSSFAANAESGSSLDKYASGWYAPILEAIKHRVWISQTMAGSQPADVVAAEIVRKALDSAAAPAAIGAAGSWLKTLLYGFLQKWLPASFMDSALSSRFGLAALKNL